MLYEIMSLRKRVKSKTKQLCCWDEFSDYVKYGIQKPSVSTQVIRSRTDKKDIAKRTE